MKSITLLAVCLSGALSCKSDPEKNAAAYSQQSVRADERGFPEEDIERALMQSQIDMIAAADLEQALIQSNAEELAAAGPRKTEFLGMQDDVSENSDMSDSESGSRSGTMDSGEQSDPAG